MSGLHSPSWYRVAALKPRLRTHFEVHRQSYGNELAFLLQDHSVGKFYRFNVNAYDILGRMDGSRSVHEIWEASVECLGDDAPTQDETIALLGRLHAVDALQLYVTPDCLELFQRAQRNTKPWWKTALRNPLSIRLPLFDPERTLSRLMPVAGFLFSRAGFVVWLLVMCWAVFAAAIHWPELTHGGLNQILDPSNLILLLFVYPVMKLVHEFGHAIATRKWGGEVHEMGITLLVFVPIPYIDASSAAAIKSKKQRIIVSAAGMMVEMFIAALALLVWINVEPGMLKLTAFNIMLVGSISTVLFNGNPLLRFDAYYILKDAIEIPNLAARSSQYISYLAQRYLCGVDTAESPVTRQGEARWFVTYGVAAFLFKLLMTFTIVLFVAGKFFIIGILLAIWSITLLIVIPLIKLANFVIFSRTLAKHRVRSLTASAGVLGLLMGLIFLAPLPSATRTQGVLWLSDLATVQAGTEGVVTALLAKPATQVSAGQPLLALSDPFLEARINVLQAELDELQTRYRIEILSDRVEANVIKEQINRKQAELSHHNQRAENLVIHSAKDGYFVLMRADDLLGRHVHKGEQLGYILDETSMSVRVAVPQNRIGLVREELNGIDVKLAEAIHHSIPGALTRRVPAAQQRLPSKVLGTAGGGSIPVDPADESGLNTIQSVFMLDVALLEEPEAWRIGQRAYVRLDHGRQSLAQQWYRAGRQLFIRRFGV